MAKILLGPTVIGIRGTVAGITFSQNAGGPYARGWHQPPNPRAAKQLTARVALGNLAVQWRALTAAQKATWVAYAALPAQVLTDSLGQPYSVSGFAWWISCSTYLIQSGLATIATAPVGVRLAAPTGTVGAFPTTASGNPSYLFEAAADPNRFARKTVSAAVVNSLGQRISPTVVYFMKNAIPDGAALVVFGTQQQAKFGTSVVGQRMFVEQRNLTAEGQVSAPEYLTLDCA